MKSNYVNATKYRYCCVFNDETATESDMSFCTQKGFTLIEMLIALAISAVLLASIYNVFISQRKIYSIREQVAEMQQNVRAGMVIMVREIRTAGYSLSSGRISYYNGTTTAYIDAITPTNSTSGPDGITVLYGDSSCTTSITSAMPSSSAILNVSSTDCFAVDDLIIISNGKDASLLEVTQVLAGPKKLQHNPGGGSINPPGGHNIFPPGGYGSGSSVLKLKYLAFRVNTTTAAHPTLEIDADGPLGGGSFEPLAENIEDLQIAYQLDTGAWSSAPADPSTIRTVRLNIRGRTINEDRDWSSGQRPALEDHAAATGNDGYRRMLLRSEVKVRNLGP